METTLLDNIQALELFEPFFKKNLKRTCVNMNFMICFFT